MRKKKEGLTLGEKIELALETLKTKSCVSLIDDSFLVPELSDGNEYFIRRSNFLREDGRKLDIVDEVLIAKRLQQELEKAEAERDRTFEEFKLENEDFIEGRLTQQRSARISNEDQKSQRSKSNRGKGTKYGKAKSIHSKDDDDDDAKSQKSRKADEETAKLINKELENMKFDIPDSCKLVLDKKLQIEKFESKFLLVAHPYPVFEGEMLIIQPKKGD